MEASPNYLHLLSNRENQGQKLLWKPSGITRAVASHAQGKMSCFYRILSIN